MRTKLKLATLDSILASIVMPLCYGFILAWISRWLTTEVKETWAFLIGVLLMGVSAYFLVYWIIRVKEFIGVPYDKLNQYYKSIWD